MLYKSTYSILYLQLTEVSEQKVEQMQLWSAEQEMDGISSDILTVKTFRTHTHETVTQEAVVCK